jgi:Spy/CpxP family protein refolding chaperone
MKRALKCIILVAVTFFITGITLAQPGGKMPSPPSVSDIVSRMQEELSLTDEQVTQITPIIQDELSQMQAFMEQGVSLDTGKSKMEALRESTESKLSQYLTPDQLTQWKSRKQQPPSQGGDGVMRN